MPARRSQWSFAAMLNYIAQPSPPVWQADPETPIQAMTGRSSDVSL
jgi:hypothetical protein